MFCRPLPLQREILLWLALTSLAVSLAAVEIKSGGDAEQLYRVRRWTAENGLPQNTIKALVQTRDGYIWAGTLNGLARFDGVRFKVFDHGNTPEMKHDAIDDLAEDAKDGSLWIGTRDVLLRYRDGRFQRYSAEHGILGIVGVLQASRFGGTWFTPQAGYVALIRDGLVRTWKIADDPRNGVQQISEESASALLVLLYHRVYRLDLNTGSVTRLELPKAKIGCLSIFKEPDGTMWLCTGEGIWQVNNAHWNQVTTANPQMPPWPERIYRTRDGQLWVAQRESDRVSWQRLVDGRLQPFSAPELPTNIDVTRFLEDREGNLWAGSTRGLFRLQPHRLKVYSRREGIRNDDIKAVTEGRDGTIWLGTADGVSAIRQGQVINLPPPLDDPAGWGGVGVFLAESQNALCLGGHSGFLTCFKDGEWTERKCLSPLWRGFINPTAIYEDRQQRIWIGTGTGVAFEDNGRWNYYATTNDPAHTSVRVIHQDRRGDMWFGTFGGGLNGLHEGKITSYTTTRGKYNNRAWWIHEDAEGVFWVGSEDGLNRFVPPGVPLTPSLPHWGGGCPKGGGGGSARRRIPLFHFHDPARSARERD